MKFLQQILTQRQCDILSKYPNVVEHIAQNKKVDIKGIDPKTLEEIKNKIKADYPLAKYVEKYEIPITYLRKLYQSFGDELSTKLEEDPYMCLLSISGIGFKIADSIILKIWPRLRGHQSRAEACAVYLLKENERQGNCWQYKDIIRRETLALTGSIPNFPNVYSDDYRVAIKSTYECELYIAERLNTLPTPLPWKVDTSLYMAIDGKPLTVRQCDTIKEVSTKAVSVLCGYGGSGKSFSVKALIKLMTDNKITFRLMAPTGRAAKVLSGYCGFPATTIHRGLGFCPPYWTHNESHPLEEDVVIVDEFSMCDIFLFKRLLQAIDFNTTRLLIIGDDAQLPSVGPGNCLHDLPMKKIVLDKIFRYGEGGLATAATDTRNSKSYLKPVSAQGSTDRSYAFFDVKDLIPAVVSLYQKCKSKNVGILSAYNIGPYGTEKINEAIQLTNPSKSMLTVGQRTFKLNDPVIQIVNEYDCPLARSDKTAPVFNGEIGKIVSVGNSLTVDFDGKLFKYSKANLHQLKLAYAISIHKSQGGQFDVVILVTPRDHAQMLNSNLLYVGISRAAKMCFHFGNPVSINLAIKKKANLKRQTFLAELTKGEPASVYQG